MFLDCTSYNSLADEYEVSYYRTVNVKWTVQRMKVDPKKFILFLPFNSAYGTFPCEGLRIDDNCFGSLGCDAKSCGDGPRSSDSARSW